MRWWRINFLRAELLLAAVAATAFVLWSEVLGGWHHVHQLMSGRADIVFGTFASVYAALLGFVIATTAIVAGFAQHERMTLLRRSQHYPTLWKVLIATIRVLAAALLVALVSVVASNKEPTELATYAIVSISLLAIARMARSIWALEGMIRVIGRPDSTA